MYLLYKMYKKIITFLICVKSAYRIPRPLLRYISHLTQIPVCICPLTHNFISKFAFTKENGATPYEHAALQSHITQIQTFPQIPQCYAPKSVIKVYQPQTTQQLHEFCEILRRKQSHRIATFHEICSAQPEGVILGQEYFYKTFMYQNIHFGMNVVFEQCLIGGNFHGATLTNCIFKYCTFDLQPHAFYGCTFVNCKFDNCVIEHENTFRKKYNVSGALFEHKYVKIYTGGIKLSRPLNSVITWCDKCDKKINDYAFNHQH
jgi:hypothetical protein